MKRILSALVIVFLLNSCSFVLQHKGEDIQWEDNQGNSIYFNWDIFGDAVIKYKNADGVVTKLRNYAYADSLERMNIYVSQNSRYVCLLVYQTTNSKYKTGSVLHIIQLSEAKDFIEKETIIDDIYLDKELKLSDTQVTYYDINGISYNFELTTFN